MTELNLFEEALKQKVRFDYRKGTISAEDLWDLSLAELDGIYRGLSAVAKISEEGLLTNRKTKEDKSTELKLSLVKHVFELKQAEADSAKEKAKKKEKKTQLLGILERKQNMDLENKSPEELQAMIDELVD